MSEPMSEPMSDAAGVEVVLEDARWEAVGLARIAEAAGRAALADAGLDPDACEVVVLGCDDARIAVLNESFRGRAAPTNVLAWPSQERDAAGPPPTGPLGDVAIAYETCAAESQGQGKTLEEHATHLLVHAVLHLLGHDHEDDDAARLMEGREVAILCSLGKPDPYVPRDGVGEDDPARRQKAPPCDPSAEARA